MLITHKLAEAIAVADRITVLRRGRVVARNHSRRDRRGTNWRELMIGEIVDSARRATAARRQPGEPVLEIENLTLDESPRAPRFSTAFRCALGAGEIAGIAGVDGNGQAELVEVLAGVRQPSRRHKQPCGRGAMAVIPQNRDLDGLILDMRAMGKSASRANRSGSR